VVEHQESDMRSETQIHAIARQMIEKHGFEAIAQAAHNAVACEGKGDTQEAKEWRHIEDAMKIMRGPHES
jgi:N-acetyl-anhydromuramyl-L-alanine amidase AmpD